MISKSSMKLLGGMTAGGAALWAGINCYTRVKQDNRVLDYMQSATNDPDQKIKTGGYRNGYLWDGNMSINEFKQVRYHGMAKDAARSASAGAIIGAVLGGITLFIKSKIK